jgi:hypothetical protein
MQLGRTLTWDAKTQRVSGDEEANRLLRRPYRHPAQMFLTRASGDRRLLREVRDLIDSSATRHQMAATSDPRGRILRV